MADYINISMDNVGKEHLCCAISDKKHQAGVDGKRAWLQDRLPEGHVFRKLDAKGKVFIEYAPLEAAWIPVEGENYLYIYCLWVSGSFAGKGYGRELLHYCLEDAKTKNKSGVCVISAKKKKPFLSDMKFLQKYGFEAVDEIAGEYILLANSFDGTKPNFNENAKKLESPAKDLTIYYGLQCPYIADCVTQIQKYCEANNIKLVLNKVDTLEKAKAVPCVFNNWAVFYNGEFKTVHILNEGYLKKMLANQ